MSKSHKLLKPPSYVVAIAETLGVVALVDSHRNHLGNKLGNYLVSAAHVIGFHAPTAVAGIGVLGYASVMANSHKPPWYVLATAETLAAAALVSLLSLECPRIFPQRRARRARRKKARVIILLSLSIDRTLNIRHAHNRNT